ncbi:S1 family peptidase [Bradyrhizobium oligotrophicum]|uniref:S1 family peptidase n=1 Tax=Bradyrhizobium oligotrophicum TaxID=44255 RepID=UPI003EB912FE
MSFLVRWISAVACLWVLALPARAALLPPYFISSVVALGSVQFVSEPGKPPATKWVTEGTGFFFGYLVSPDPDPSKRKYAVFLITAGHVIKQHPKTEKMTIGIRVDATDTGARSQDFEIPLGNWFFHPNTEIDIAAVQVPIEFLKSKGLETAFTANDEMAFDKAKLIEAGVSAGDGVFILGFPMGLTGETRNYVIARQGAIARLSQYLENASTSFLVDSFVFPGNSGGPVILRPEMFAVTGTKPNQKAALIGLVQSYQPYTDIAFSAQTKHPRITFEENSGLAVVIPVDFINELVKSRAEAVWKEEQVKVKPAETAPAPPQPQPEPAK